jgi:hypothetical protein
MVLPRPYVTVVPLAVPVTAPVQVPPKLVFARVS